MSAFSENAGYRSGDILVDEEEHWPPWSKTSRSATTAPRLEVECDAYVFQLQTRILSENRARRIPGFAEIPDRGCRNSCAGNDVRVVNDITILIDLPYLTRLPVAKTSSGAVHLIRDWL